MNDQAIALDLRRPRVILRTMLTFDRAADDFLNDCRRRGFTPRTIATYQRTCDEFSRRLPRDRDVNKVTTNDVRRYLATKAHLAPGTVAGVEAHLASLFKSLYLEEKIETNPIDRLPRTRRSRPEDLDVTTVQPTDVPRLLEAADSWSERLALAILVYMGRVVVPSRACALPTTIGSTVVSASARRVARPCGSPRRANSAPCLTRRSTRA